MAASASSSSYWLSWAPPPEDVIVSVGDLVDWGPESPAVVRFFREHPNTLAIAGNHERKHIRGIFSYAQEITRLKLGLDAAPLPALPERASA